MSRRGMREDSTPWIGYADFLTTLAVFFFVGMLYAHGRQPQTVAAILSVSDGITGASLAGCKADLGGMAKGDTDEHGHVRLEIDSVAGDATGVVEVQCDGYSAARVKVRLTAGGTPEAYPVKVSKEEVMIVRRVPGDALFGKDSFDLRSVAARSTVRSIGRDLEAGKGDRDMILVEGHTDDREYAPNAGTTNWMLSAQRAAAVAAELESVGLDKCELSVRGFGATSPREPVQVGTDIWSELERKRALNRRVEFKVLPGQSLCADSAAGS